MNGLSIGLVVGVKAGVSYYNEVGYLENNSLGVISNLSDDSDWVRVLVYSDDKHIVEDYYRNGKFSVAPFQFGDKVIDTRDEGKKNVVYQIHSLKYNKKDSIKFFERSKPGLRAFLKPISMNGESVEFIGRSVEVSYEILSKHFEVVI